MLKLIATIALLATALPAVAHAQDVTRQIRVSYADLDLAHPAGVKALDRRLHAAVETVCADTSSDAGAIAVLHCRKAALAQLATQRAAALAAANTNVQLALNIPAR